MAKRLSVGDSHSPVLWLKRTGFPWSVFSLPVGDHLAGLCSALAKVYGG